jgi:integrase
MAVIGPETLAKLKAHRQAQRELKMRNRTTYSDHNLIFAREADDLRTPTAKLGGPITSLAEARFYTLVKAAGVARKKFHSCRHTVATLSLQAGTPPHVVADRLGHSVAELMKTYAHALPNQQQDAAARLGALLHG